MSTFGLNSILKHRWHSNRPDKNMDNCDHCRSEHSLTGARKNDCLLCTLPLDSSQHRELGWVGSQRRQHRAHTNAATSQKKTELWTQRFDKLRPLLQTLLSLLVCSNVCRQSSTNKGSEVWDIVAETMFKNTAGTLIGQTKTWITAINPMARPLSLQGD